MFNLKYARTRQWLLYWVLTFIFFPVLIQFGELPESEQSESEYKFDCAPAFAVPDEVNVVAIFPLSATTISCSN